MYDSQEKAAFDLLSNLIDAREEGRKIGLELGEVTLILTLQEILKEPVTDESEFENHSLAKLQAMSAESSNSASVSVTLEPIRSQQRSR